MTGIMMQKGFLECGDHLFLPVGDNITVSSDIKFNTWKPATLKVKKLTNTATLPTKTHNTDAGFDLYCSEDVSIDHLCRGLISTGISIEVPYGCVGLIWPRSGLAVKNGIDVMAGVIDHGYTGEIKVCIFNTDDFKIFNIGDKIAQILIQPISILEIEEVESLNASKRGEKGFGSSG